MCVCLTVRKHLDPFLLQVVVARGRALVAGELWTICDGGWLPRRVQILIGQKRREKEVLRNGTSRDKRAWREQGHVTTVTAVKHVTVGTQWELTVLLSSLLLVGSFDW